MFYLKYLFMLCV